ncbi:MAG: hypothetical protein LBL46_03480 [Rickettsiales bacterium]|jgi:hypothetical protein|nr:hypothetical protein [Rickettsiales bacterium]
MELVKRFLHKIKAARILRAPFSYSLILLFSLFGKAFALEHKWDGGAARLTGYGTLGRVDKNDFEDYLVRGQLSREIGNRWNIGAVYAYDQSANAADQWAKDAFLYVESGYGRIEAGWTDSIAGKLALVLPDVGGTRLRSNAFFLPEDFIGITNPVIRGTQYAWRANYASLPTRPIQIGFGAAGATSHYKSSNELGLRFRDPSGRTKSSVSLGFSYIERPDGMSSGSHLAPVVADARYQGTIGLNIQSGSLIWAATGKVIVDDNPLVDQNGTQAGTGFSYEFLKWAASANYIYSDIWTGPDAHTGIFSVRYKANKFLNIWGSVGAVWQFRRDDFVAGGFGIAF